jgi:hypothetical protein
LSLFFLIRFCSANPASEVVPFSGTEWRLG